jgi:type VI secretion system secreted protein Hcp
MTTNQKFVGSMLKRIVPLSAIALLIAGAPIFMTLSAPAAIDTFIRIDGVQGESKEPAHMNWITVSSVVANNLKDDAQADRQASAPSVSELNVKSTATGSGAGAGKVKQADLATGQSSGRRMHQPFTIVKEIDKASPLLVQACASGKHFSEVDVDLASGGHYKLSDVVISSDTKSAGERPVETISFTYQKIELTQ